MSMHVLTPLVQNFWDPIFESEFHYNRETSTWNSSWWFGEPVSMCEPSSFGCNSEDSLQMWETTGRASVISANLMWCAALRKRYIRCY